MSITWLQTPKDRFSHDVAHMSQFIRKFMIKYYSNWSAQLQKQATGAQDDLHPFFFKYDIHRSYDDVSFE